MSENNQELNINHEHFLLINILNTMYNDNLRQINNLTASNNEIRSLITRMLNNSNRERHYSNRYRNYSNRGRNNSYNTSFNNRYTSRNGININNTNPLVFDYIIPQTNTGTWTTTNLNRPQNDSSLNRLFQNFFEPIEVHPTPSQIELATRIVRYSDILNPRNRACPISLENFNDNDTVSVIRFCSHIFNTEQLNTWFRSNCRCPVCRYDIRSHNPSNIENLNTNTNTNTNTNNNTNSTTPTINTTLPPTTSINTSSTETSEAAIERNNRGINSLYYTLLTPGVAEDIVNLILDPSGNTAFDYSTNTQSNNFFNILSNFQRK
jgi:hypothetical protein